jgi:methylated-DNA-[protein]-cysteine S-methyltransferase
MTHIHFGLFGTAIGTCALVWGGHGVLGVQLPESDAGATRRRVARRFTAASEAPPTAAIQLVVARIEGLLAGAHDDLADVPLDMVGVPPFHRRVYALARAIPPGATLTYGELATRLGEPNASRAVGQALGANPFPIVVPCHRVLAAGGRAGGFSADGGVRTKLRLLQIEGAPLGGAPGLFDEPRA